jgi:hypothetical protein
MTDGQRKEIHGRMIRYLKSPAFKRDFYATFPSTFEVWKRALSIPFARLNTLSKHTQAWSLIFSGEKGLTKVGTGKLFRQFQGLVKTGQVVMTYVLVRNVLQALAEAPLITSLTIGNFNDGIDDTEIAAQVDRLARIATGNATDPQAKLLSPFFEDLDYKFGKRRVLPVELTNGVQVIGFDFIVKRAWQGPNPGIIPCFADPKEGGLMWMIPPDILKEVLKNEYGALPLPAPAQNTINTLPPIPSASTPVPSNPNLPGVSAWLREHAKPQSRAAPPAAPVESPDLSQELFDTEWKPPEPGHRLIAVAELGEFCRGKWVFIDDKGKVLSREKYDEIICLRDAPLFLVRQGQKKALIKPDGTFLVPFIYDEILLRDAFKHGLALVQKGMKVGVIDLNGKLLSWLSGYIETNDMIDLVLHPDSIMFRDEIVSEKIYRETGKFVEAPAGLMDLTGKVLVEPKYSYIEAFSEDLAAVSIAEGKKGFVDRNGRIVIPPVYDQTGAFENGRNQVFYNGKRGWIDKNGNFTVDEILSIVKSVTFPENGYRAVNIAERAGLIDEANRFVVPLEYDGIGTPVKPPYVFVWRSKLCGLLHLERGLLLDCKYEVLFFCGDGRQRLVFKTGSQCGIISPEGAEISSLPFFDKIDRFPKKFSPGKLLFTFSLNAQWGVMDAQGNIVVAPEFDEIRFTFCDDLGFVRKNEKWAMLGRNFLPVTDFIYDGLEWESHTFAAVEVGVRNREADTRRYGLLGADGTVLLPPVCAQVRFLTTPGDYAAS